MLVRAVLNTTTSHIHLLHRNRACTLVARPTRIEMNPLARVCGQPYIGRGPFLVLGHTALQIERQVVAVHQNPFAELLLELLHIWLYSREIQPLRGAQWKEPH